jgi:metallo-beta-lactamase family protein
MKPQKNTFTLTFLGGAGTVTGSKILIETLRKKVLIDCGLFQGLKELRKHNWEDFPVDPSSIDELILTHAHLDHCGYIPLLVKKGFKGSIHCTYPSKELAEIILLDSAKIQEEDAERASRYNYSKHSKPEPLYKIADVIIAMKQFVPHDLHEWIIVDENIKFQLLNAGHILGSSFVDLRVHDKKIVFSGDIGRKDPMLMYPPAKIEEADYIVLESTYGDRIHEIADVKSELLAVINETYQNRGVLMIPSFAVERTQELIYLLYQLRLEDKLPKIQIYLDSPMGIHSSNVYNSYQDWQNISHYELSNMYSDVIFISNIEQSKATVADKHPKIILAGSGMMEGGRILHYMNQHIEDEKNTLLFVGFQGEGTRGRAILEGSPEIKFFGEYRQVNCQIRSISSLSAHADQGEMLDWLRNFKKAPTKIFLNHGEPHQTDALRAKIEFEFDWPIEIPKLNQEYTLT